MAYSPIVYSPIAILLYLANSTWNYNSIASPTTSRPSIFANPINLSIFTSLASISCLDSLILLLASLV